MSPSLKILIVFLNWLLYSIQYDVLELLAKILMREAYSIEYKKWIDVAFIQLIVSLLSLSVLCLRTFDALTSMDWLKCIMNQLTYRLHS